MAHVPPAARRPSSAVLLLLGLLAIVLWGQCGGGTAYLHSSNKHSVQVVSLDSLVTQAAVPDEAVLYLRLRVRNHRSFGNNFGGMEGLIYYANRHWGANHHLQNIDKLTFRHHPALLPLRIQISASPDSLALLRRALQHPPTGEKAPYLSLLVEEYSEHPPERRRLMLPPLPARP